MTTGTSFIDVLYCTVRIKLANTYEMLGAIWKQENSLSVIGHCYCGYGCDRGHDSLRHL
jgi:hypothetical protein